MPPDEPTDEERLEELPEDGATPFRPADPNPDTNAGDAMTRSEQAGTIDSTHPQTDTNIQPEEAYDEGLAGTAEAEEPQAGNAVVDFNPSSTQSVAGADDDEDKDEDEDEDEDEDNTATAA